VARKLLELDSADHVLDVGCGSGYFERWYLIGKVADVKAVDVNEAAIAHASSVSGDGVFQVAAGEALPFEDGRFTKVLCLDTLEHVEDRARVVSEAARVLAPGGRFVVSVPNDFANWTDRRAAHREGHMSEDELRVLLEAAGLRVERVIKTSLLSPLVGLVLRVAARFGVKPQARRVTGRIEDLDYSLRVGTGFALIMSARKQP
jgi:SAM-dependent methyltransferase